jgi:hypothetical protein
MFSHFCPIRDKSTVPTSSRDSKRASRETERSHLSSSMTGRWKMRWRDVRRRKLTWERWLGSTRRELREFKKWPTDGHGWWCSWSRRTSKALTRNCGSWSFYSRVGPCLGVLVPLHLHRPICLRRVALVFLSRLLHPSSTLIRPQSRPQPFDPIQPAVWSEFSPIVWSFIH